MVSGVEQCSEWKEGRMVTLLHGPGELTCFVSRSVVFVCSCQLK